MKKLFLTLMATVMAIIANAGSIYVVGSGTVDGKSLPGSPAGNCVEVTSDNDTYVFTVKASWMKISTINATSWADFNRNGFTVNGKSDYVIPASELGKTLTLWRANGSSEACNNINPPSSSDEYTYTLTAGAPGSSNSTLVVTAQGEVDIKYTVYLRGSFNNFGTSDTYKFETTDNENFTLAGVTLNSGTTFKIADADWGAINYGNGSTVYANTTYTLPYNGNDMTLAQNLSNATIKFNINTHEMYIEDATLPSPDKKDYTIYFSNTNNWDNVYVYTWEPELAGSYPGTQLSKNAEGLYYWTVTDVAQPEFQGFQFNNGKGSTENGELKTNDIFDYTPGATYYPNGTTTPPTGETDYTSWYVNVQGEYCDNNFMSEKCKYGQPNAAGVVTITDVPIGTGTFEIRTSEGDGNYYSTGTEVKTGEAIVLPVSAGTGMTVAGATEDAVYTVEFDCTTNTMTLTLTSGGNTDEPTPGPGGDDQGEEFTATFNFNDYDELKAMYSGNLPAISEWTLASPNHYFVLGDDATLTRDNVVIKTVAGTTTGANAPRFYSTASATTLRYNDGSSLTITAPEGYYMTEIYMTSATTNTTFKKTTLTANGEVQEYTNDPTKTLTWTAKEGQNVTEMLVGAGGTQMMNLFTIKCVKAATEPEPEPELPDEYTGTFTFTSIEDVQALDSEIPAVDSWTTADGSNKAYSLVDVTLTAESITLTGAKGDGSTDPRIYSSNGMDLRFYKGNALTITAPEGYQLDKVVFNSSAAGTYVNSLTVNIPGEDEPVALVYSSGDKTSTWTASEDQSFNSLVFGTTGSTRRVATIDVTVSKVGTEPEPEPEPETTTIYVVGAGDGLGWDLPGKEYTGEDGIVTFEVANLAKFRFATVSASDWDEAETGFNANSLGLANGAAFGNDVAVSPGQTLDLEVNMNDIALPWEGNYTITIDLNKNQITAYTTTPKPSKGTLEIYFRGQLNDWGTTDLLKYDEAKDAYVITIDELAQGSQFKFADAGWGSEWTNGNTALTNGTYNMTGGNNMALGVDMTNVTFTLDVENNTLTIDGTEAGDVDYSGYWFNLICSLNDWASIPGVQVDEEGGTIATLEGEFALASDTELLVKVWNGSSDVYYTAVSSPIAVGEWVSLKVREGNDGGNFTSQAEAGESYTVSYDFAKNAILIKVADTDRVELVEAADADAVYYNLQGVRVNNPERGIYIKVVDGKAVKVLK